MTAKEALDVFGNIRFTILNYPHLEIVNQNEAQTAIEILKELVERDTPIPIITVVGFSQVDYHCPKCNEYVDVVFASGVREPVRYQYCPACGQRWEW